MHVASAVVGLGAGAALVAVVAASAVVAAAASADGAAGRFHCQQTSKTEEEGQKDHSTPFLFLWVYDT